MKAHIYREPVNIRLGAEKLADYVRWSASKINSGDVFIFFNRKRNHCKVVWRDDLAFSCLEKRLERGNFAPNEEISLSLSAIENCVYGGIAGKKEFLHALMGNVLYMDDHRQS